MNLAGIKVTDRQLEVWRLIALGHPTKAIADKLLDACREYRAKLDELERQNANPMMSQTTKLLMANRAEVKRLREKLAELERKNAYLLAKLKKRP